MAYTLLELLILGLFIGVFVCGFILIARYNKKTIEETKTALAKKGLKQKQLSCKQALFNFFTKVFDFKSRAALSELWWVVLCVSVPLNITSKIWPMLGLFLWFVFLIPCLSLSVRRFRDVGMHPIIAISIFVLKPIIEWIGESDIVGPFLASLFIALGLACLIITIWVNFRASDPFNNKYGKIPNLVLLNKKEQILQKNRLSFTNALQKIYFNTIKNTGNVRLLFISGLICSFICIINIYGAYSYRTVYSLWNFLWVIFWFYAPFLLVFPIKYIIDGYKQDKGDNNGKI